MQNTYTIRNCESRDISPLKKVLDATQLFPAEALDGMIAPFLDENSKTEIWLAVCMDDLPIGFCFAREEEFTDRTWNMLAIAVDPTLQVNGAGSALLLGLENWLRKQNQRLLMVDTSSTDELKQARRFYFKNNYVQAAQIKDFWAEGDDKVTFSKTL